MKGQNGITLVALIITIIVLLILTVVAISAITDQGLFTKSQEAVNAHQVAEKVEQNILTNSASHMQVYLNKVPKAQ